MQYLTSGTYQEKSLVVICLLPLCFSLPRSFLFAQKHPKSSRKTLNRHMLKVWRHIIITKRQKAARMRLQTSSLFIINYKYKLGFTDYLTKTTCITINAAYIARSEKPCHLLSLPKIMVGTVIIAITASITGRSSTKDAF